MYTCEVVMKTAQKTGESVGIIQKSGEFGGNSGEIQGKFGGNCGKIGELCFPNEETEFPDGKMREKCYTKIPIWGICVKRVGEMKGK